MATGGCGSGKDVASAPAGGTRAEASTTTTTRGLAVRLPQPELKTDGEMDSDSYWGEPDNDNSRVFGHAANAVDAREMTTLVRRYYADAAAANGDAACRLIYSIFAEAIPEDYGRAPGPPSLRGDTCGAVMSKLFKQTQSRLRLDSATLEVTAVRVDGNLGSVLMSFDGQPAKHYLETHRERGGWKIHSLLDREQPVLIE